MTSLQRKLVRAACHRTGAKIENDRPQPTVMLDYGYCVLHPTRGWRRISYARVEAQRRMAQLLDNVVPRRQNRAPQSDHAGINRHTGKPHEHRRAIARQTIVS